MHRAEKIASAVVPARAERHVVVVTGCTSGLGLELCRELARRGHQVIGCGRRQDRVDALAAELGAPHSFIVLDASKEEHVKRWADSLRTDGVVPDMVFNNAGTNQPVGVPWEVDFAETSAAIDVNLKGVLAVCRYFIPLMIDDSRCGTWEGKTFKVRDGARTKRIINLSSGLGHCTNPILTAYSATKWGVEGLSKSIAQALQSQGLTHFLCVPFAPGMVGTEMNKLPGCRPASEWAPLAAPFLLALEPSQSGSSVCMPGWYSKEYMDTWSIPEGLPLPKVMVAPK
mmetsp:Transcript_8369/g.18310  ORF Transcript_8369/g.18310 Transcript_8369/m.18310 type:complete len:285 (-) Transcript_8369:169-1023(-)|eukprot:CAMPEP_0204293442 /NCGR_PEP_ID=MMETSP0468-20130131/66180_1 /ASSEMBLY_ACC=CAM_ASM_000383 /TAXON_ID=2969 /ORGANISM="Oxyrrhis marina" /LENGTH=284 /DNA_ID=CAMNT_0051271913 /DNA_START=48 /DNA_END=902 /DNA_ORIENTATION=-